MITSTPTQTYGHDPSTDDLDADTEEVSKAPSKVPSPVAQRGRECVLDGGEVVASTPREEVSRGRTKQATAMGRTSRGSTSNVSPRRRRSL